MKRSFYALYASSRATAVPFLVVAFACLFCLAAPLHAQTITATVSGTVTDPAGAVVPGAAVTVTSNERGGTKTVSTDDEGRYTIPFLQPGTYTVTIEGTGFGRVTSEDVRLETAQTATLDFTLSANVQESVEVEGSTTPLLQTETSQLETTIEQKLLEDLPTGDRNIFNFIPFVPGTIDVGAALGNSGAQVGSAGNRNFFDSNFSVNGGRASSNDVLLDGVTNTIGDFGGVAVSPPQDAVREFKVQSGVAPAEYGRTAGSIVNVTTRSGTNDFHGALYEYFQDRTLNANGWARNRTGSRADGSPVQPRVDINRNQFGGAIGGPVYLPRFGEGGPALISGKNRTFFFFNYEARREDNPFTRDLLTVPTEAQRLGDLSSLLDTSRPARGLRNVGTQNQTVEYFFAPGNPFGAAGAFVPFGQIFNPYGTQTVPYFVDVIAADGTRTRSTVQGRPIFPNNDLRGLPTCAPGARTQACIDPVARNILGFIPLPNTAGSTQFSSLDNRAIPGVINNFFVNDVNIFTRDIISTRIDQRISDKQSLFGRFSYEARRDAQPNYFNSDASNARTIRDRFGNFTLNHIYSFTPNIVNNARYGYTRVRANQMPNGQGFDPTTIGLPAYLTQGAANLQFPDISIGAGDVAATLPGNIPGGSIGGAGNNQPRDVHTVADSVTIVRGAHTFKTGGEYRLYRFFPFQFFFPTGSFSFNNQFTRGPEANVSYANSQASGSPLASFLLGLPSSGQREAIAPITVYKPYYATYFQDDWKIRRNLTLNLGLRYDFEAGTADTNNQVTNFDLDAASPLNGRVGQSADPFVRLLNPDFADVRGLLSFPEGAQTRVSRNRFAPRVGFAYSYDEKTTIRAGYGIFHLPLSLEGTSAQGVNFSQILVQQANQGVQVGNSAVFLSDPFPGGIAAPTGNTRGAATLLGGGIIAVEPERRTAYNQQYNLVVSRELARNLVIDFAYVGSRGIGLPVQTLSLNQLSSGALNYARANFNQPNTCSTLTAAPFTLNAPCANVAAFFAQNVPNPLAGLIPGTPLNAANVPRAQLLRRFPQYQAVTLFRPHIGESNYNALQVSVQKRFSEGLSFNANYTFSKLLDTSGVGNGAAFLDPAAVQDIDDYNREYSLSTLDVPHRFTALATYELPFGRGRRFGGELNRVADFLLGGYQVSGTATIQSGAPLLIVANGFAGTGLAAVGNAVRRPDRGVENTLGRDEFRTNARAGVSVYDRAAFQTPAEFVFGNSSRTSGDIRRDGFRNVDLSLIKNFRFGERNRQRIEVRGEFLNAFNYVVFGAPVNNINNANFGLVTTQSNRPRIIQLVARYTF